MLRLGKKMATSLKSMRPTFNKPISLFLSFLDPETGENDISNYAGCHFLSTTSITCKKIAKKYSKYSSQLTMSEVSF